MQPEVIVFELAIPTYWLCAIAGLLACSAVARFRFRRFRKLASVDATNAAGLMLAGLIVGARLLAIATLVPIAVEHWGVLSHDPSRLLALFSNGMVFYGGLFGSLAALALYARRYGLDLNLMLDFFVPLFPLFHAFGRVGCFLNGCCYGRECAHWGIAFASSASAPAGVPLFPIQLVCAALNLALFAWTARYERGHRGDGTSIYAYLAPYAAGRLIIEFFRGDGVRGIFLGLSSSQWISIAVLACLALRVSGDLSIRRIWRP